MYEMWRKGLLVINDARKGQDVATEVLILDGASAKANVVTMRILRPSHTATLIIC